MVKILNILIAICVFWFILILNNKAQANTCEDIYDMSGQQRDTLVKSFIIGSEYDLGYSLAAIAWKESQAGKYLINISDPSFGVHHILITSAMKRSGMKDTSFNRNRMASKLLEHNVSAKFAIQELIFWKNKYGEDWIKVWSSYNAGYNWKNGLQYSHDILLKIKSIRKCLIPNSKEIFI